MKDNENEEIETEEIEEKPLNLPPEDNSSPIHRLNVYCLTKIFQFLSISTRLDLESVCQRWKRISKLAWYDVKQLDMGHELFEREFKRCFSLTEPDQFAMTLIERCGSYLKDLEVSDPWSLNLFPVIGQYCRNLSNLELSYGHYDNHSFEIFTNLENLRTFRMYFYTEPRYLDSILMAMPAQNLRELELCSINVKIELSYEAAAHSFSQLKQIKRLRLMKFIIEPDVMGIIGELSNIKELILSFCNIADPSSILNLSNLQELDLTWITAVRNNFLEQLSSRCPNLQSLNVTACHRITDVGIRHLLQLAKLEKLSLLMVSDVTDEFIKLFHNLKLLRCGGCSNITNNGMLALIKYASNLEHLYLVDSGITYDFIPQAAAIVQRRNNNVILNLVVDDNYRDRWRREKEQDDFPLLIVEGNDGKSEIKRKHEGSSGESSLDDDVEEFMANIHSFRHLKLKRLIP